jgi:hypothetical protein
VLLKNYESEEKINLSNHSNINIKTVINNLANGSNQSIRLLGSDPDEVYSKTIVVAVYEDSLDIDAEVDFEVNISIKSNNGKTYTGSKRYAGGYGHGGVDKEYHTIIEIPIEYTGKTPYDITYTYTSFNSFGTYGNYISFVEYFDDIPTVVREDLYFEDNVFKDVDGVDYSPTPFYFDKNFFSADDAKLVLKITNK